MKKTEFFEHYAKVAEERLKEMPKIETFRDCKSRKEFSDYILNVFIAHYGLRCSCDVVQDWDFNSAAGHYQKCELWKFCHVVNRCLDWAEEHKQKGIFEEQLNILEACAYIKDDRINISKKYLMELLVRPSFGDSENHYKRVIDVLDKIKMDIRGDET